MRKKTIIRLIAILFIAPFLLAQSGCPTATTGSLGGKKLVKDDMIMEIKGKIKTLGGTPLTEDEAKYKGVLKKDKYLVALEKQLEEIKQQKEDEKQKAEADKKAEEEKKKAGKAKEEKEKDRATIVQRTKKEIYMLGGTPILEFEVDSEDKYIAALKKQIDELKAEKEAKEKEINESLPDWYTTASDDRYFYVPGTAVSDTLQLAIDNATNAAFRDLGKRIDGRLSSKAKSIIKEAGLGEDTTSRTETNKIYTVVLKEVDVSGYEVVHRKMVTLGNGKYRMFVLLKYPLAKTYTSFVEKIENNPKLKGVALAKIKNTDAFKDLEKVVNEYTGS